MTDRTAPALDGTWVSRARIAGLLYLLIIVAGISVEFAVRASLIAPGDPAATAENILAAQGLFRMGFFGDSLVFLADAAVAALLYLLLRPFGETLALVAMAFRLSQTAILGLNLLNQHAALVLLTGAPFAGFEPGQLRALAYLALELHGLGYDLGLLFFGVHCILIGALMIRAEGLPTLLGGLLAAAGAVYLIGSYVHFLAPGASEAITPIYVIALAAEAGFCGWLLTRRVAKGG